MTHGKPAGLGRYLFWGVASALLAAFIAWTFMPVSQPVDLGEVVRGPLEVRVVAEGRTRVRDIYTLSAPVAGRLLRVEAEAGDPVKSGQTQLAVIQPADPSILDKRTRAEAESQVRAAAEALALAGADVDRAKAELAFARSELDRARQLRQNETISQRALDVAELDVAKLEAALKSAQATAKVREHELETARVKLIQPAAGGAEGDCCVSVTSPVDGEVLRVLQESAGVVQAGAPLLEVGDPGRLEVVADLLTSDAARILEGAEVTIGKWGGADLQARVRKIEPFGYTKVSVLGIEEQRVDVIMEFTDPASLPPALGHGFHVEAAILNWRGADVLKAPMSALFRSAGGWAVFIDDGGSAKLTEIEVGHMNSHEAEVLSGLSAGDRVILHPSDRVVDGVSVTPRED